MDGQPAAFCHGLQLPAPNGKQCETDYASTDGLFRIIQPPPSPKAKDLKPWRSPLG